MILQFKAIMVISCLVLVSIALAMQAVDGAGELSAQRSDEGEADPLFLKEEYPQPGTIPMLNRKVFKASRATSSEYPFMASIRRNSSHYLAGAVVTQNIVVTVAHPLYHVPIYELQVVAGESYSDHGTGMLTVLLILIHQHFNSWTLRNDLALVRVYEGFNIRLSLRPIPVAEGARMDNIAGSTAFVSAWGRCDLTPSNLCLPRGSVYFPGEIQDPMLRSISFTLLERNYYCDEYVFKLRLQLPKQTLCQGEARSEELMAPCMAAPGAPMVVRGHLLGLQSWGFGCGYQDDLPLVYTDLRKFKEWLGSNLEGLENISKSDLQQLFEATKSFQLREILFVTRKHRPPQHAHSDMTMEPIPVDHKLANLTGKLYDLRDFLGTRFRSEKREIYRKLKLQIRDSLTTHAPPSSPDDATSDGSPDNLDHDNKPRPDPETEDDSDSDYYEDLAADASS